MITTKGGIDHYNHKWDLLVEPLGLEAFTSSSDVLCDFIRNKLNTLSY